MICDNNIDRERKEGRSGVLSGYKAKRVWVRGKARDDLKRRV